MLLMLLSLLCLGVAEKCFIFCDQCLRLQEHFKVLTACVCTWPLHFSLYREKWHLRIQEWMWCDHEALRNWRMHCFIKNEIIFSLTSKHQPLNCAMCRCSSCVGRKSSWAEILPGRVATWVTQDCWHESSERERARWKRKNCFFLFLSG